MAAPEAPPAGWYPDPTGGLRLRWWDGSDWTDRYRARPNISAAQRTEAANDRLRARGLPVPETLHEVRQLGARAARVDTDAIVAQVRQATRAEIDRAAEVFSTRARAATKDLHPLITQYTSRLLRWLRIFVTVVIAFAIIWLVVQVAANAEFFEWLGDRLDNLSDDTGS